MIRITFHRVEKVEIEFFYINVVFFDVLDVVVVKYNSLTNFDYKLAIDIQLPDLFNG